MQRYLEALHEQLADVRDGEIASYIPELTLADPDWFGVALITVDGNVYQAGDSRQPFTVQSISKAITYGLALEDNGFDAVLEKVGVEPSGDAFNSISLEAETGRPRNPMINAGAIATTGLIEGSSRSERLKRILKRFENYTGRPLAIDEAVYASERDTGHRNRAIAHLLRNADILTGDPEDVLDVYFKQCSIIVTARDLALMGACLANSGVNPITGVVALDRRYVEKVLSVMSTCGMYDYSGNWIFNVGMPAKSGVGGGIMAVLPGQFGLGVFSPPLETKGNSVRGIRVCEQLSLDFGLHLFKVARATSSSVIRVTYDASAVSSKRLRNEAERAVLEEYGGSIRTYELQGELMYGSTDSVIKAIITALDSVNYVIVDFRRVVEIDGASAKLLADLYAVLYEGERHLCFTGTEDKYLFRRYLTKQIIGVATDELLRFSDTDRAMEWCEDQLIFEHISERGAETQVALGKQYLFQDLSTDEIERLYKLCCERRFASGETIFRTGDEGTSLFLIGSGLVDIVVKVGGQRERRLVTMRSGMSFGEFAMVTGLSRSTDARAVVETLCYELHFVDIAADLKAKLLVNLAKELSRRLSKEARELQTLGWEQ